MVMSLPKSQKKLQQIIATTKTMKAESLSVKREMYKIDHPWLLTDAHKNSSFVNRRSGASTSVIVPAIMGTVATGTT